MNRFWIKSTLRLFIFPVMTAVSGNVISAQELQLVWSDEFEGTTVDPAVWQFETGPTNDNVHFYTGRMENATVTGGTLRIIALEESYQGYAYTSALISTEQTLSWRYGRVEARIKLPGSPGFVPAFWMLPADDRYGWWPQSGEIDIMEHPTNVVTTVYGTIHTGNYNLFDGPLPPQGGTIEVPDAEDAFHLYAVEWNAGKIDFFVDDQKYYSFENDGGASATWPFDQPFYLILNLAVGGGWVGTPGETTVFPAVMEVDYVRVYQDPADMEIQGAGFATYLTPGMTYSLGAVDGAAYQWSVPGGAEITSGQNSRQITVDWGIFGGDVEAVMTTGQGTFQKELPVRVSRNMVRNAGFEKGVKYWKNAAGYPAKAAFSLDGEVYSGGAHSVNAIVSDPSGNAWDVQLSQQDLDLQAGIKYHAGLALKAGAPGNQVAASVIDLSDFGLAGQKTIMPGETWDRVEFDFIPSKTMTAAFNIDMGGYTGSYYLDDFILTYDDLAALNLLSNPDFFDGEEDWTLTTLSTAVANGSVADGEYTVDITSGGDNAWDVHLGQTGLPVEQGYKYTVSFDAYADDPGQVTALVGMNGDPWTVYSDQEPISITTERQTYAFTFVMNAPSDPLARMGFDIGGAPARIYFDNIMLRKGDAAGNVSDHSGSRQPADGIHVYPQPVGTVAFFSFDLPEPMDVNIRILSLDGRELKTIDCGLLQKGAHHIRWEPGELPSGIYLYRFFAGDVTETGSLVLVR